jgi:hypothetical protein
MARLASLPRPAQAHRAQSRCAVAPGSSRSSRSWCFAMNAKSLAIGLALATVVGPNVLEGAKKALGREILARSGQG